MSDAGRVTHIHIKVHITDDVSASLETEYTDSHLAHTGQFFFPEDLIDSVYALSPYRLAFSSTEKWTSNAPMNEQSPCPCVNECPHCLNNM